MSADPPGSELEADLERARDLSIDDIAAAIESIGFECTRCGACCRGHGDDEHTATAFPDEVRALAGQDEPASRSGDGTPDPDPDEYDWRDVARPMPYGLQDGENGLEGETFEWALQTDGCGDCTFYTEDDGIGACTVHENRPLICRTYPFSVALSGTSQPMGEPVDEAGIVRAHECEGLGRDISREDAEELARTLKQRAIRELEEAIALLEAYEPVDADGAVVVHDSEGAKRPDGSEWNR
ncbi:YkgJ family cysteine cluster protein [Natronosalvus vescus]|uniref:YkgJ family cysteine cluster protein n=1 Tax=Natronosalvus vescus TaxID=2953881 RepID=UPI002091C8C8|nr:YkgJ family cysteine cluster protein [Natronosalvus vescus]